MIKNHAGLTSIAAANGMIDIAGPIRTVVGICPNCDKTHLQLEASGVTIMLDFTARDFVISRDEDGWAYAYRRGDTFVPGEFDMNEEPAKAFRELADALTIPSEPEAKGQAGAGPVEEADARAGARYGWKCNACTTVFTSEQVERLPNGYDTHGTGPDCPYCKAFGQYTYRYDLHEGDPCKHCGVPHDEVPRGRCVRPTGSPPASTIPSEPGAKGEAGADHECTPDPMAPERCVTCGKRFRPRDQAGEAGAGSVGEVERLTRERDLEKSIGMEMFQRAETAEAALAEMQERLEKVEAALHDIAHHSNSILDRNYARATLADDVQPAAATDDARMCDALRETLDRAQLERDRLTKELRRAGYSLDEALTVINPATDEVTYIRIRKATERAHAALSPQAPSAALAGDAS